MTAPVQPQAGPETLQDWIQYLHNAAGEPKDSPYYAESRQAVALALRHIHALNTATTQTEANQQALGKPLGGGAAAGVQLLNDLSFGAGEPLAGFFSMLTGKGFGEGAARYREGLGNVQAQHPNITAWTGLPAPFLLPAGTIGTGTATAVKAGVPLTVTQGLGLLARGAASGAVPGAISGFSAGGEDPADFAARLHGAKRGAEVGGVLGLLGMGAAMKLARGHVERAADITARGNRRALVASRLEESRMRLAAKKPAPTPEGVTSDEAAVARALGIPVEQVKGRVGRQAVEAAAARERATVSPVAPSLLEPIPGQPRGLFAPAGISPTPRATYPPTLAEMQGFRTAPTRLAVVNADKAQSAIRRLSYADLARAFQNPETPKALRQLLVAEFQRRGITLPARARTP